MKRIEIFSSHAKSTWHFDSCHCHQTRPFVVFVIIITLCAVCFDWCPMFALLLLDPWHLIIDNYVLDTRLIGELTFRQHWLLTPWPVCGRPVSQQDTMILYEWHDWRSKANHGGAIPFRIPDQVSKHTLPAKGLIRSYTRLRIQSCRARRQSCQPVRIQADTPGHFLPGPCRPSACQRQERYGLPRDLNG